MRPITLAEIKASWETGPTDMPPRALQPDYEGKVIAKIRIKDRDGNVWQPPKAPARTAPGHPNSRVATTRQKSGADDVIGAVYGISGDSI